MKVDRKAVGDGRNMKIAVGIILIVFVVGNIAFSQEVRARLLIQVQGRITMEDNVPILQGDNGNMYLLQGKDLGEYTGKEVRVLGEPVIPPENLKGKIRLVVNVMEIEEIKKQGGEVR